MLFLRSLDVTPKGVGDGMVPCHLRPKGIGDEMALIPS